MKRHHPLLVAMHWLSAILVILTLISGGIAPLGIHMVSGILIFTVFLLRVTMKIRAPADHSQGLQAKIANSMHLLLYGLVFGVIASGIGIAVEANLFDVMQGNVLLPPGYREGAAYAVHALLTDVLMTTIAAHAAAALWHQFIQRDQLFSRMWFGTTHRTGPPQ